MKYVSRPEGIEPTAGGCRTFTLGQWQREGAVVLENQRGVSVPEARGQAVSRIDGLRLERTSG